MEHLYVINGNEFGVDLSSKKNFTSTDIDLAEAAYELMLGEDLYTALVEVDPFGRETIIKEERED